MADSYSGFCGRWRATNLTAVRILPQIPEVPRREHEQCEPLQVAPQEASAPQRESANDRYRFS